jgi:hypothetical protein
MQQAVTTPKAVKAIRLSRKKNKPHGVHGG